MKKKIILIGCVLLMLQINITAQKPALLFNGKNLDGWYIFLNERVGSQSPDSAFTVHDNMLHITGKSVGYICTKKIYKNFHLTLEFKWGEKKYPPRLTDKRDSGILYYFVSGTPDKIWPRSFECQIQEGDCGDFWLAESISLKVKGKTITKGRIPKLSDNENLMANGTRWRS